MSQPHFRRRLAALLFVSTALLSAPPVFAERSSRLRVANKTPNALSIYLGEFYLGSVHPHNVRTFHGLFDGKYLLKAVLPTGTPYFAAQIMLLEKQLVSIDVPPGAPPPSLPVATIQAHNNAGLPLAIYINDDFRGLLDKGGSRFFLVSPGAVEVQAMDEVFGGVRYRARWDVTPGQVVAWPIGARLGTVNVVNRYGENLFVRVNGTILARVRAGEARSFAGLEPGSRAAETLDENEDAVRHRRMLEVAPGGTLEWVLEPVTGALAFENATDDDLDVGVGGVSLGGVKARSSQTFVGVRAGWRYVHASQRGMLRFFELSSFSAGAATNVKFDSKQETQLEIANASSGKFGVFVEETRVGQVTPGETRTFQRIPTGRHLITARDDAGLVKHGRVVWLRAGEKMRWEITADVGGVAVDNRSNQVVTVYIEGRLLGSVQPHASATFGGLPVGRRALSGMGDGGDAFAAAVDIKGNTTVTWTIGVGH